MFQSTEHIFLGFFAERMNHSDLLLTIISPLLTSYVHYMREMVGAGGGERLTESVLVWM